MTVSTDFALIRRQFLSLANQEQDRLANSANFVGLLFAELHSINWLGIYVLRDDELILGPFQGLPACIRIPVGSGVCGTAAEKRQTLRVADVHAFAGHIACDPASKSELVVPLISDGRLVGVLDIDSPFENRFSADDQIGIEMLCTAYIQVIENGNRDSTGFI